MAIKNPVLSPADLSAAAQSTAPTSNTTLDTLGTAVKAAEFGVQKLKDSRLKELDAELQAFQAETVGALAATTGREDLARTPEEIQYLKEFQSDAERLEKAQHQLTQDKYRSQSEILLRRHLARAPGLEDEFRAVAKNRLRFDPTGAGVQQAFSSLADQQAITSANATAQRNAKLGFLKAYPDQYVLVLQGVKDVDDALSEVAPMIANTTRANRTLKKLQTEEGIEELEAKRFASTFSADGARTIHNNITGNLSPEFSAVYQRVLQGESAASLLSPDQILNYNTAVGSAIQKVKRSFDSVYNSQKLKLASEDRAVGREAFDSAVQVAQDLHNGVVSKEAAALTIQTEANELLSSAIRDPNARKALAVVKNFRQQDVVPPAEATRDVYVALTKTESTGAERRLDAQDAIDKLSAKERTAAIKEMADVADVFSKNPEVFSDAGLPPEYMKETVTATIETLVANIQDTDNPQEASKLLRIAGNVLATQAGVGGSDEQGIREAAESGVSELLTTLMDRNISPILKVLGKDKVLRAITVENGQLVLAPVLDKQGRRSRKYRLNRTSVRGFNKIARAGASVYNTSSQDFLSRALQEYKQDIEQRLAIEETRRSTKRIRGRGRAVRAATPEMEVMQEQINNLTELVQKLQNK